MNLLVQAAPVIIFRRRCEVIDGQVSNNRPTIKSKVRLTRVLEVSASSVCNHVQGGWAPFGIGLS